MNYPCCKHCDHDKPLRSVDGHSGPCMVEHCLQSATPRPLMVRLALLLSLFHIR